MKIQQQIRPIIGNKKLPDNPYPYFCNHGIKQGVFSGGFPEELKQDIGSPKRVTPYTIQDNYSLYPENIEVKIIILENENLRAEFLPEYGGRLYSLYDKNLQKELLAKNNDLSARNIGLRQAWFAGGVEWNIGNYGHCYTTYDNVFCAILQDDNNNDFLRIYEFERLKSVFWQIDFHLPDGANNLMCYVKLINPFPTNTTIYYWSNMALSYNENMRFLFSGSDIIHKGNGKFNFSKLPYAVDIEKDITYPKNIDKIFEYYVQNDNNTNTPWQVALYPNDICIYEISTKTAFCKKMFHWGEYQGAYTWQKTLASKIEAKAYAELQTGIAPSQFHDKLFSANSTLEWGQCFGGYYSKYLTEDYSIAQKVMDEKLKIYQQQLETHLPIMKTYSNKSLDENNIIHQGNGFGYIEQKRIELDKDGYVPSSMLFPESSVRPHEVLWLHLLSTGKLTPPEDLTQMSYMTSYKWLPHLETAIHNDPNWFTYYHYSIMALEVKNFDKVYSQSYNRELQKQMEKYAYNTLQKSVAKEPSHYAYRALALLANKIQKINEAKQWWNKLIEIYPIENDYPLLIDYCEFLYNTKQYQKIWDIFISLKNNQISYYDRLAIMAARAALYLDKTKFLEQFFKINHTVIFEGETSLTDIWYTYQAIQEWKENNKNRNIQYYFDKNVRTKQPPKNIDFRFGKDQRPKLLYHN